MAVEVESIKRCIGRYWPDYMFRQCDTDDEFAYVRRHVRLFGIPIPFLYKRECEEHEFDQRQLVYNEIPDRGAIIQFYVDKPSGTIYWKRHLLDFGEWKKSEEGREALAKYKDILHKG